MDRLTKDWNIVIEHALQRGYEHPCDDWHNDYGGTGMDCPRLREALGYVAYEFNLRSPYSEKDEE